jgi:outer membrane immunogenic protein
MKKLVIVALALATYGTSAIAADMPPQAPVYKTAAPIPVTFNWTGFYVGGHAGYGWGDFRIDNLGLFPPYSFNVNGFVGGAQVGFNWQWNWLVLGLEGDVSFKDLKGNDGGFAGVLDSIQSRWGGTVRGRLGYAADRWLLFVTGGLAWLNYRYDSTITPAGPGVSFSNTDMGWTVGGGVEYAFDKHWSAKAEYLYFDYRDQFRAAAIFAGPWITSLKTHEVRGGINYRF